MLDLNAGRVPFLFFLKAVQKKQIYIPAFVRADGTAVAGHMKWVHVADDHDDHKVAGGQGTHSQKIAHGKLSKHDWFHALPTEHKSAIVMAHATDHQSMESAGSRVSKMRDKIFKGIAPSAGEWRAWGYIDAERRQKVFDEIKASGRISFFEQSMNAEEVAKGAEDRKERLEHQPAAAADDKPAPAAEQPKEEPKAEPAAPAAPAKPEATPEPKAAPVPAVEAPKPAPKAEESAKPAAPPQKAASGSPEHQAVLDAIDAKMLPADAVNAYANVKYKLIKQLFEAGDAKGLLNLTYGTNPYGKFAAKLANMALKVLGSEHQVAPGQKAGTHPALAGDAAPKKAPPASGTPASPALASLVLAQWGKAAEPIASGGYLVGKNTKNGYGIFVVDGKLGKDAFKQMMAEASAAGIDTKKLYAYCTIAPYTSSSMDIVKLSDIHGAEALQAGAAPAKEEPKDEPQPEPAAEPQPAAPAQPEEAAPAAATEKVNDSDSLPAAGALAMPTFEDGKEVKGVKAYYEKQAQKILDMVAAGDAVGLEKMKVDGLTPNSSGKVGNTFKGKTANSKILLALHDAALAQAKGAAGDAPAPAAAPAVDAGPKEGDTKPAVDGGTLVLKDGHWIKQDEPQSPAEPLSPMDKQTVDSMAAKDDAEALQSLIDKSKKPATVAYAKQALASLAPAAPAAEPAGPVGLTDAEIGEKPSGVNSGLYKQAKEAAIAGDLANMQLAKESAEFNGYPNTANHIAGMIDALQAKQGMAQPEPAAAPAAPKSPVPPEFKDNFEVKNFIITMKLAPKHLASLGDDPGEWVAPEDVAGYEALSSADKVKVHEAVASIGPEQKQLMDKWLDWHDKKDGSPELNAWLKNTGSASEAMALAKQHVAFNDKTPEAYASAIASLKKYGFNHAAETILFDKMNAHLDKPAPDVDTPQAVAADDGPKDGDTKQGADGMLVFQNGRWHKVKKATDPAELVKLAASIPLPKLSGTNAIKMGKIAKGLKAIAETKGAVGLAEAIKQSQPTGAKTIMVAGGYKFAISNDPDVASSNGNKLVQYAKALQAAMAGTSGAPVDAAAPKVVSAAPAAPDAAQPMDSWSKVGEQKGFNAGGFFKDLNGQEWYCKFPSGGEAVIRNELLANKLAGLAGLSVPDLQLVKKGGQLGLASKIIPGAKENKAALLDGKADGLLDSFAVHAWLANWDSVGNNPAKGFDNILVDDAGKAHHIDQGGALLYGGAGGAKGQFTDKVIELTTMLDPAKNANTAAVFGKMSPADITASVKKVAMVSDDQIIAYCMKYGPGDVAAKQALAMKMIARKKDMLAQYPKAAKVALGTGTSPDSLGWVKLKPGEKVVEQGTKFGASYVKIEIPAKGFNAAGIPQPFEYNKSGSPFVNAANTADIKSVYDTALAAQDPAAVLGLTYPEIVKATGEKTGKMLAIDEHPSKAYVKEYVNQVAAELDAQLKPTYRIEHRGSFTSSYSSAAAEIAALVKPISHENFKHWSSKAADYLVLDKAAGAGIPVPEAGMFADVEPTDEQMVRFKKASDAAYSKLSSGEKSACVAYTGSAYVNWNSAMRLGAVDSADFKAGEPMRKAFAKAAVELPEGIILHRGIGVGGDTYKAVVGAVIQDGSFQSCSYGKKAAFSGHQSQLRLHISKGVKGMMATTFSKFGAGERELILHPNCRYVVMGVKNEGGKNVVDILVLPHEE